MGREGAYLIFVISFTQAFCAVEIFYTQNALFVTKLNSRQKSVNRSNALCKIIHCGKIPIYCVKSPIQCKITCCGQNCTLNVWLHHENHTLSLNYTTLVKYMDHFHENFTPDRKKLHRHRLWCLWQMWGMFIYSCSCAKIYIFWCIFLFANWICLKLVFLSVRGTPQFLWLGVKISLLPCWFSLLSNRLHVLIISQR